MQETNLGSLGNYRKGSIEIIKGKPGHYAMSNVFEVANQSAPYEKVVVGKNLKYVIETLRAEGTSPWFTASHDEFAVALDGEIDVHFIKPSDGPLVGEQTEGTRASGRRAFGPVDGLRAPAPRSSGAVARGRGISLRSAHDRRAARADDPRPGFGREVGRHLHPVSQPCDPAHTNHAILPGATS